MRHVLITGAGRGIGLSLARTHAAQGWRVAGVRRDVAAPEPGIDWGIADVTDPAALVAVAAQSGPLDRVICNAGVYPDRARSRGAAAVAATTAADFDAAMAVNVTGVFLTVQACLPHLRSGAAQIAIIGSQMGSSLRAPGGSYAYRASKAAVLNLGRNLAADLAGQGVAVGVWHPGWVRTEMGGAGAEIGVEEAVTGLMAGFAALAPATSGQFLAWDGTSIPF